MMKRTVFAALLVAFSLALAPQPAQAVSEACRLASTELEDFLQTLPKTCQADEDCAGYPLRMDPCAEALMLHRKSMESEEVMALLGQELVKARMACMNDYPKKPVCKKKRYWLPACSDGVCINDWRNRPDTLDMPKSKDELD